MTRPRVLISPGFRERDEIFGPTALERLNDLADVVWILGPPSPDRFAAELHQADAVVFGEWPVGQVTERAAPLLRALMEVAGGHVHGALDYRIALRRGIAIGSCAPSFTRVVAEHALGLMIDAGRGITASDRDLRAGEGRWQHDGTVGRFSLLGCTVGFVGCGGIARQTVELLAPFGARVLGHDPFVPDDELRATGFEPSDLAALFERARVVVVAAAPTGTNEHLVDRELLAGLTPGSVLVLVSRASVIDFDAAVDLANAGHLTLATDVFPDEPMPADAAVRTAANTVLTSHIAGALPGALLDIGDSVVADLDALLSGRAPTRMQYLNESRLEALVRR